MPPSSSATLFGGRLALTQPARGEGYRFNVDALLLARHALLAGPSAHTVDLGAGVGAVGLSLLVLDGATRVTLVERDPAAAALARSNAAPFGERARVVETDVATLTLAGVDAVVCNPPYTAPAGGRPSPVPARDAARRGDLDAFVAAAARLRPGLAHFVYPARLVAALLASAARHGLGARALRWVHARADRPARIALVTFEAGATRTAVGPPWLEHGAHGPDGDLADFVRGVTRV